MECTNCGSPLAEQTEICAFCGTQNADAPKAEVPTEHQRGEGREVTKTHDDSLAEMKVAIEHSIKVHEAEDRRSGFFVKGLSGLLIVALVWAVVGVIRYAHWENTLNSGVMAVQQSDFKAGRQFFSKATSSRWDSVEAHLLLGTSYYVEILKNRKLDHKADNLEAMRRELETASGYQPNLAQAHYFMALYHYEKGDSPKAVAELESCLASVAEIADPERRQKYSDSGASILGMLKNRSTEKLVLFSEIDSSILNGGKKNEGIEVPFGR